MPFGLLNRAFSTRGGTDAISEVLNANRVGADSAHFYRTLHWLEKACAEKPLFIARDDPHWSDADSLELLAYVCRRIETLPVCVLGTLRPEPDRARGFVDNLATTTGAQRISLGPLSSGDGSENRPRPALTL